MTDPLAPVRLTVVGAKPFTPAPETKAAPEDAPPKKKGSGGGMEELPADCPVVPLGVAGDINFYLDATGQYRELHFREHSRNGIISLFGPFTNMPYDYWGRTNKKGEDNGFEVDRAANALMGACAAAGPWNPLSKIRGAGAWRGERGELILHCGDSVYISPAPSSGREASDGKWDRPGVVDGYVYPAAPPMPRFAPVRVAADADGPAAALLEAIKSWNFQRGEIDAILHLGWIGSAIISGALDWRSIEFLTGGPGTGKSTLLELTGHLMGDGMLSTSDPSAASIWQTVGYATLPIRIDEFEGDGDNRQQINVIKLARQAASGGLVMRGSNDHKAVHFRVRSSFLFSAVDPPPLQPQDYQRMAILELKPLAAGAKEPKLDPQTLRLAGHQLRRRMVDGWMRFEHVLENFKTALAAHGHTARGRATFGTLLACAFILLSDDVPDVDECEAWAGKLAAGDLMELSDAGSAQENLMAWLTSSKVDPYRRGEQKSVGEILRMAAGQVDRGEGQEWALRALTKIGIKLKLPARDRVGVDRPWLIVANNHRALHELFEGSDWGGRAGKTGAWVRHLRRIPGARFGKMADEHGRLRDYNRPEWMDGQNYKGTWLPYDTLFAPIPDDERDRAPGLDFDALNRGMV